MDAAEPDIDVVIPTLNCSASLQRCLERISAQDYTGKLNVIVVDGGSVDFSREIAKSHGATVYNIPGMWGFGLSGARHYGEQRGSADYVWNIDADNWLVESTVARDLVRPFLTDAEVNISIPETAIDPSVSSFNNWISRTEIERVNRMKVNAREMGGWYLVEDMFYGLTNAALIRRHAMESAGGYDSDARLMLRLRRMGLSKGAIVKTAHFYHNQVTSAVQYRRKLSRRIVKYGKMTENELREYFLDFPHAPDDHDYLIREVRRGFFSEPMNFMSRFWKTKDRLCMWGVLYPFIIGSVILRHPICAYRVYTRFL